MDMREADEGLVRARTEPVTEMFLLGSHLERCTMLVRVPCARSDERVIADAIETARFLERRAGGTGKVVLYRVVRGGREVYASHEADAEQQQAEPGCDAL